MAKYHAQKRNKEVFTALCIITPTMNPEGNPTAAPAATNVATNHALETSRQNEERSFASVVLNFQRIISQYNSRCPIVKSWNSVHCTKQKLEAQYEKLHEAVGAWRIKPTTNQKALIQNQNFLTRWAVDLHHTHRSEQSGFQAVTQLLGFTHQTHRVDYYIINKNNPEIASEIVFSSLHNVMPRLKTVVDSIAPTKILSSVSWG